MRDVFWFVWYCILWEMKVIKEGMKEREIFGEGVF